MNKKGALTDLILWSITTFAFIIIVGIIISVMTQTRDKIYDQASVLQESIPVGILNVSETMENTIGGAVRSYSVLGWASIMIIVVMLLNILITSALIKTHPFIFVAYIFVLIISVITSVYVRNLYETLYSNPAIASGFSGLMGASWFILNQHIIVIVVGFIAGILLFINIDWGDQY